MNKIIVIGCPGSGKSTFSKKLSQKINVPLYHLDMMKWNSDATVVSQEVFESRLNEVLQKNQWIIDGNYGGTMKRRMECCDSIIFLDYSVETCLAGVMERRGKKRSDLPWIEPADEVDAAFIQFIKAYPTQSRPQVLYLLNQFSDRNIIIFKNRMEAEQYLLKI